MAAEKSDREIINGNFDTIREEIDQLKDDISALDIFVQSTLYCLIDHNEAADDLSHQLRSAIAQAAEHDQDFPSERRQRVLNRLRGYAEILDGSTPPEQPCFRIITGDKSD